MQLSHGSISAHWLFDWREYGSQSVEQTVHTFLELGDAVVSRWVQSPNGVMLMPTVPGNPASGAIYAFNRQTKEWYLICFEGNDDQISGDEFDRIFNEYGLFRYIEQPALLAGLAVPGTA